MSEMFLDFFSSNWGHIFFLIVLKSLFISSIFFFYMDVHSLNVTVMEIFSISITVCVCVAKIVVYRAIYFYFLFFQRVDIIVAKKPHIFLRGYTELGI